VVVLLTTLGFGVIGWVDDYRKVVHRNPKGLSAKAKMFWQSIIALLVGVYLWNAASLPAQTELIVAVPKTAGVPALGVRLHRADLSGHRGSSNAVNLTDGLDGLAILPTVMVSGALAIFAYVRAMRCSRNTSAFPTSGRGELAVFCSAIAGRGLAFLWFNAYPAEVFMGDVGALALGAALGVVAVIVRQELVLFIMGGVFVVEPVSVMIQVASFKLTGKRVFRMAPLHTTTN